MSTPAVHPVETPPVNNVAPPRMRDLQGMPGTIGSLILRLCQFGFAVVAMCVMVTTSDFPTVTAFSYLVAAVGLQIIWSLVLAIADVYAILVQRSFRNAAVVSLFTIGDGVTSTLTFAAACASAGITVLISNDLDKCNLNHCTRFMAATAMAFLSWFATSPSFFMNFWSLASR
ncbi:CASP-like protein 5A1 [Capsicum annuum]|uniref:CASP-like protein 5A1 isoform X1 n=1 Tax=Capsicum annuum TaxID=4072 RepID=UPI0007BFB284|nr:CASP-like protein 5A1 isoform X1 [Capsicum annuum]KAF3668920.1 CASP-like protein 5A1 [Capsicum annuum]